MNLAMNPKRVVAVAGVALLAIAGVFVGSWNASAPAAETYVSFQSPSGNAHCTISTEPGEVSFASCELREFTGKIPKRPADCDLDWVPGASVDAKGRVSVFGCQGDTDVNPSNPKLAYGKSMKSGPYTCTSATSGITCKVKSGRGFLVSKGAIKAL